MKARNPRVLRDVTPRNTPQSKRISSRATGNLKDQLLGSAMRIPAISLKDNGEKDHELPKVSALSTRRPPTERKAATSHALPDSTPLGHTRIAHSATKASGATRKEQLSPLPPSSPPSMSSFDDDAENRPPPQPEFEDDGLSESDEVDLPEPALGKRKTRSSSSDDPFGFIALERRLKIQREIRRRGSGPPAPMHVPKVKKEREAARGRAPLGEIAAEPVASTSAARAPTPYHPSDDIEDMYLDVGQSHLPEPGSESSVAQAVPDAEPMVPAEPEAEPSEEENDPTRTPQPHHVANIIPLASPFSSRDGTPCDRSLPDSPLSSPSPVKPLTVARPLPTHRSSTVKKEKGKIVPGRGFPSSTPIPTPLPAGRHIRANLSSVARIHPVIPMRVPRAGVELDSEDPPISAGNMGPPIPKLSARRGKRMSSVVAGSSSPSRGLARPRKKLATSKGRESGAESSEDEHTLPSPSSPLAGGKRKASLRRQFPVKRMRAEVVITKSPPRPTRRSQPKPSTSRAKPASKPAGKPKPKAKAKAKAKGKGKERAGTQKVGDEDSDQARARQARIDYFRNLDKNYSLAKENVYVV